MLTNCATESVDAEAQWILHGPSATVSHGVDGKMGLTEMADEISAFAGATRSVCCLFV